MTLKFAVIGETGQLARALKKQITEHKYQAVFFNRQDLDLSASPAKIKKFIEAIEPVDAVILAAAYTAVDKAKEEADLAMAVNGRAPGVIGQTCKTLGIPLVYFSTDYVFNGTSKLPYKVDDEIDPVNMYGQSKRAGEIGIEASGCAYAILRTSWVFDGIGQNFLTTMLSLAQTRPSLSIVDDQLGRPTYSGHLAKAGLAVARALVEGKTGSQGIFHVSNSGPIISWAEFAQKIFDSENLPIKVNKIPTAEYPTPARRPLFSALDLEKFESIFDYKLPSWQEGLRAALADR